MILSKTINFISQCRGTANQRPHTVTPQNAGCQADISSTRRTHGVCHGLQLHEKTLRFVHKSRKRQAESCRRATKMWVTVQAGQLVDWLRTTNHRKMQHRLASVTDQLRQQNRYNVFASSICHLSCLQH